MIEYKVKPLKTSLFTGTLDATKLEKELNRTSTEGWEFVRSIHESKKTFLFFKREAHFLVYKRVKS